MSGSKGGTGPGGDPDVVNTKKSKKAKTKQKNKNKKKNA